MTEIKIKLGDGIKPGTEKKINSGCTVQELIKQEGLASQTIVPVLNGKVTHPATALKEGDVLELVGVIYGG